MRSVSSALLEVRAYRPLFYRDLPASRRSRFHFAELFAQYLSYLSLLKFDMLLTVIVLLMLNAENIMHSAAYILGIVMVVATFLWCG